MLYVANFKEYIYSFDHHGVFQFRFVEQLYNEYNKFFENFQVQHINYKISIHIKFFIHVSGYIYINFIRFFFSFPFFIISK